jgi:hypothetical protein
MKLTERSGQIILKNSVQNYCDSAFLLPIEKKYMNILMFKSKNQQIKNIQFFSLRQQQH